jgi:hypothetical protein
MGGIIASKSYPEFTREFMAVAFSGFPLSFGSIAYMMFSGRCVHCQRRLGKLFFEGTGSLFSDFLSIDSDLQFCPYCGRSLDDDATT